MKRFLVGLTTVLFTFLFFSCDAKLENENSLTIQLPKQLKTERSIIATSKPYKWVVALASVEDPEQAQTWQSFIYKNDDIPTSSDITSTQTTSGYNSDAEDDFNGIVQIAIASKDASSVTLKNVAPGFYVISAGAVLGLPDLEYDKMSLSELYNILYPTPYSSNSYDTEQLYYAIGYATVEEGKPTNVNLTAKRLDSGTSINAKAWTIEDALTVSGKYSQEMGYDSSSSNFTTFDIYEANFEFDETAERKNTSETDVIGGVLFYFKNDLPKQKNSLLKFTAEIKLEQDNDDADFTSFSGWFNAYESQIEKPWLNKNVMWGVTNKTLIPEWQTIEWYTFNTVPDDVENPIPTLALQLNGNATSSCSIKIRNIKIEEIDTTKQDSDESSTSALNYLEPKLWVKQSDSSTAEASSTGSFTNNATATFRIEAGKSAEIALLLISQDETFNEETWNLYGLGSIIFVGSYKMEDTLEGKLEISYNDNKLLLTNATEETISVSVTFDEETNQLYIK